MRVYEPARFGEGMQSGTVYSDGNQRRLRKERRDEDCQWAELQAKREAESKTLVGRSHRSWTALIIAIEGRGAPAGAMH